MKTLLQLRDLLSAVTGKLEALNSIVVDDKTGEVRDFTETEKESYTKLEDEAKRYRSMIERAEAIDENKRSVARLDSPANKAPDLQVIREENHNDAGEYRGYRSMKEGGLGEFLADLVQENQRDAAPKRLKELRAATGANEGVGYEGGSLLQSDHAENMFTNVVEADKIASRCTTVDIAGNSFSMNMSDESSLAIGSQFGGIRGYWRGEAGQVTPTMPKLREVRGKLGALEALMYATEDQLEDTTQLASLAQIGFPTVLGYQLGDAIFHGDGGVQPLGIINAPCTVQIDKESGQAAATLVYLNLDNMVDRLLPGTEDGAVFYIHPSNRQKMRNVYVTPGSNTDFMPFLMKGGGAAGQQVDPINGFPIERTQQCKVPGTIGDIILANLKHYYLFRKKGIRASESMHVAFLTSRCTTSRSRMRMARPLAHRSLS